MENKISNKRPLEDENEEKKDKKKKVEEIDYEITTIKDDGTVKWCENFLSKDEAKKLYDHLMEKCSWIQGELSMYGKKLKTPRLQSWMADEDVVKGLFQKQKQLPWSKEVSAVRERLEKSLNCRFDYVLLNRYRDGKDYIGFHSDGEAIPAGKDIIASVSLGQTRRFLFRHRASGDKLEYSLTDGSLIVMEGKTQKYWKHSVPKELRVKDPRINLTFRIN